MVPSNVGYSLREAGRHFRRNWSTVLGAIVTIFLSLFVIGLFVIGSVMVSRLVGNVEERVTIQAFIADDAKKESVDALQQKIRGWNAVESVDYKSKEQALRLNLDIHSGSEIVETETRRVMVYATDNGEALQNEIADLCRLLELYREGVITPKE